MGGRSGIPQVPSQLGIGPVSRNVIDAAVRLAYRWRRPVMLVASRGQVECAELGGGYVERWSTSEFARYVRDRDPEGLVRICRDHGGPWQHPGDVMPRETARDRHGRDRGERDRQEAGALERCLVSLRADISAGFDLLHLDTSREGTGEADFDRALGRLLALYGECWDYAGSKGRSMGFEIGLERQVPEADDPGRFGTGLSRVMDALASRRLPRPTFVVAQTGTLVVAAGNRGLLAEAPSTVGKAVGEIARRCHDAGVALKAHNVDYLPADAVCELFRSGTDAVNIAPEFGVCETRAFLALLEDLGLSAERERFLRLAYDSGKWRRWAAADTDDFECAVVAGHYVFADEEFRELKQRAERACRARNTTVDEVLGVALDRSLDRYAELAWGALPV